MTASAWARLRLAGLTDQEWDHFARFVAPGIPVRVGMGGEWVEGILLENYPYVSEDARFAYDWSNRERKLDQWDADVRVQFYSLLDVTWMPVAVIQFYVDETWYSLTDILMGDRP